MCEKAGASRFLLSNQPVVQHANCPYLDESLKFEALWISASLLSSIFILFTQEIWTYSSSADMLTISGSHKKSSC